MTGCGGRYSDIVIGWHAIVYNGKRGYYDVITRYAGGGMGLITVW